MDTKSQVRNLLIVVFTAIVAALGFTAYMAYSYGPSGRYLLKDVLLDPQVIAYLDYNAYDPKTNGNARFIFDKIEFEYMDKASKKLKKIDISLDTYAKFYRSIVNDKSLESISPNIVSLFNQSYPAHLTIYVKTESSAKWIAATKVFQDTLFVQDGNFYKVQLHVESPQAEWAYFEHPGIYQEALKIFTEKSTNP